MKNIIAALLLVAVIVFTATAQKTEKQKNIPEEQIKVEKEYDENGNLIRFDSLRVFRWSSDSLFQVPSGQGWESFFGKDFFDHNPGHPFPGNSLFSFPLTPGKSPFFFFDEEEFFRGFPEFSNDSSFFGSFLFHNDTSLFMGPNSSFYLPPGFFFPDRRGLEELRKHFDDQLRYFNPDEFTVPGEEENPYRRFMDPDQQKEWDQLIEKQHKEMKEFRKKWEKKNKTPGIETM